VVQAHPAPAMKLFNRAFPVLGLLALLAGSRVAAAPNGETTATDDDLRIRGIFETALPRTEKKNSLRLIIHPHLGDFTERDHLRTALGVRYGLTENWEATAETDAYFTHGFKKGDRLIATSPAGADSSQ